MSKTARSYKVFEYTRRMGDAKAATRDVSGQQTCRVIEISFTEDRLSKRARLSSDQVVFGSGGGSGSGGSVSAVVYLPDPISPLNPKITFHLRAF